MGDCEAILNFLVFGIVCGFLSMPFIPAAMLSYEYGCFISNVTGNTDSALFSNGEMSCSFSSNNLEFDCNWAQYLLNFLNLPVSVGIVFSVFASLCFLKFVPSFFRLGKCDHFCVKEGEECGCDLSRPVAECCCDNGWLAFLGAIFSTAAMVSYLTACVRQAQVASGDFPTLPLTAGDVACASGATTSKNPVPKTLFIVGFVGLGIMLLGFSYDAIPRIRKYFKALLDSRNDEIAAEERQARREVEPLVQQARDGLLAKNTTTTATSIKYDYNAAADSVMSLGYQEATNPSFSVSVEASDTESSSVNESVFVDLPPTRRNLQQQEEE